MIPGLTLRRGIIGYVAAASALYVPKLFWPDSLLYQRLLPDAVLVPLGSALKLGSLVVGAIYAGRSAARLEKGNPSRLPWLLLAIWLGAFSLGQGFLSTYLAVMGRSAPLPSIGDAAFLLGYLAVIAAGIRFVGVYRASGFPVGSAGQHLAIAGSAAVVLGLVGYKLLAPIAAAPVPIGERFINLAYPVLDFVVLVPTVVMLRITAPFRGRVGAVWTAMLVGFICMSAGDILFAYLTSIELTALEPLVDLMFAVGYFFAAVGAIRQHQLLGE